MTPNSNSLQNQDNSVLPRDFSALPHHSNENSEILRQNLTPSSPVLSETLSSYETQPLLSSHFSSYNGDSDPTETPTRERADSDTFSKYSELVTDKIVEFSKRRFWWFCGLGVIAIIIFQLSFLPRTSLSRDYRRWHGLHLTKNDVKRNFLLYSGTKSFEQYTNEQQIDWLLLNMTAFNRENSVNMVSDDNLKLTKFIELKFKEHSLRTFLQSVDTNLTKPVSSHVKLYDTNGKLVYDAKVTDSKFSTPSYYGFGFDGSFTGDFLFVNEGTAADYELLKKLGFVLKNKAVILKSSFQNTSISDKAQLAEQYGARALLHYSDYSSSIKETKKLDTLIQRDTVVTRKFEGAKGPSIPTVPISFTSVKPILDTLNEEGAMLGDWDYYPETGNFKLEVSAKFDKSKQKLVNVIGDIDGIIKDGSIVIGASRDSLDSTNPLSSQVILLEIMRHFKKLMKLGWKPLRNVRFVSFDGSRSGQLGSQSFVEDKKLGSVLAYINIDEDAIRGGEFSIDSSPLLSHIIKRVAKVIPVSKTSSPFKRLPKLENELDFNDYDEYDDDDDDDDDDGDDDFTSLYKYWMIQNNATIDYQLGNSVWNTDMFPFQYHSSIPSMNVKFDNNPIKDSAVYVPNANYYSYDWVTKMDEDLALHSMLIRYVGLLAISLSEHEVINFKANNYFGFLEQEMKTLMKGNDAVLQDWANKDILKYLETLFFNFYGDEDEIKTMGDLTIKLQDITKSLTSLALIFDDYNHNVQIGLIEDYPWYQSFKKVKLWAQFKLSNYKLLHLEKDLTRKPDAKSATKPSWFTHLLYNRPVDRSVFNDIYEALESKNIERSTRLMFELYEKLKTVEKKMA